MTDPTFSERHGFSPQPAPITVRQDAPSDLRRFIPRLAYDITGAIQHAMAAAECLARTVTGDKGTLGAIIKSHCVLLYHAPLTAQAHDRLALIR